MDDPALISILAQADRRDFEVANVKEPTEEEKRADPLFWAKTLKRREEKNKAGLEASARSAKEAEAEAKAKENELIEAKKYLKIDDASTTGPTAKTDWARLDASGNFIDKEFIAKTTSSEAPEILAIDKLINEGMSSEDALAYLTANGMSETTTASQASAKVKQNQTTDAASKILPSEKIESRIGALELAGTAKDEADAKFRKIDETFQQTRSKIQKGYYDQRLGIQAEIETLQNANVEDAEEHKNIVDSIITDWNDEEKLYSKGLSSLFEKGLGMVGINPETGESVAPTEKEWGLGPPGFTNADGTFSALRSAHSMLWILGAVANTGASVVSAMAGKKMGTIPNYLTDAMFKAIDYDAKVGADKLSSISNVASQGANSWRLLNASFKTKFERYTALRSATADLIIGKLTTLKENPDYAPLMKNPVYVQQIEDLKNHLGYYKAQRDAEYKKARLADLWLQKNNLTKTWTDVSAARRNESQARLNSLNAQKALNTEKKQNTLGKADTDYFGQWERKTAQYQRGLAIIDLIAEKEGLDPSDTLGLGNIILAEANLAKTFGGGEQQLVAVLNDLGRLKGRQIMRGLDSGQSSEKDAEFGYDQSWTSKQSVSYIKAMIETRMNDHVVEGLSRFQLLTDEMRDRVQPTMDLAGISDPVGMLKSLAETPQNVNRMRDYYNSAAKKRFEYRQAVKMYISPEQR